MAALTARDLMTPDVVTVPPDMPVQAVARLLADRGISAVPVLDREGTLLGIVTESDLLRRLAGEEDERRGWLAGLFADPSRAADRYARTHGTTAAEVMTTQLVTVPEDATAAHIAHLLEERRIRRVLVVREGRLRGIVSRADLLRALTAPPDRQEERLSDERIRRAILAAMRKEPWVDTFHLSVEVREGVVELHGFARDQATRRALRVLAETVPGVREVRDLTQPLPAYLYLMP
ncbi:CBS domain-containing protein [Crenalkalicoccus roseus]|uniref:CBS domain-containing protein n=1 Tax=Crenalkalicoccus roseus TaxID=1485588 RepID=UPI001F00C886|nr:CBS domain-containing protein [Crenalkalicoccus roseus]